MIYQTKLLFSGFSKALLPIALVCVVGGAVISPSSAAPPRVRPTQPPPKMPVQFDEPTVRELINTAEQGQNANILKIGYFLRRAHHPYAATDGISLLAEAIGKETVGSKRWFVLEAIRGFAGLRVAPSTREGAFESYDALFSHAGDAEKVGASDIVQLTVLEFASTMEGDYGTQRFGIGPSKEILLKAFSAYLQSLSLAQPGNNFDIPWWEAIAAVGGGEEFRNVVQLRLDDPKTPKDFWTLRTAAELIGGNDFVRSIGLLRQAKPLASKDSSTQITSLYELLVILLSAQNNWKEAAIEQQELVRLTGYGRPRLAVLQAHSKDVAGMSLNLQALRQPDADEEEIYFTAIELLKFPTGDDVVRRQELTQEATQLLAAYLRSNRKRDTIQELRARLQLGQLYITAQNALAAREVLTVAPPAQGLPSALAKSYSIKIEKLLQSLNTN